MLRDWALGAALAATCLGTTALAAGPTVYDDRDLAGPPNAGATRALKRESLPSAEGRLFRAETVGRPEPFHILTTGVQGAVLLMDPQGRERAGAGVTALLTNADGVIASAVTDGDGHFVLTPPADVSGDASVRFQLANARWVILNPNSDPYEWQAATVRLPLVEAVSIGTFRLRPETENGKIGFIHLQLTEAFDFLEREHVAVDFWPQQLKVVYPGSADYFSPDAFSIDLTQPHQWDVNLHEFGHALMTAGTRVYGGGGQHKIDECYSEGLALTEGWPSFFAAAVRLNKADPDAKFEFLVPRRAPIRVENVPADVCKGPTNEWRVAAGFWDLYDSHIDGTDTIEIPFNRLWSAISGKPMGSFGDAWNLIQAALSPAELAQARAALEWNTLLPASRPYSQPLAARLRERLSGTAPLDFDGAKSLSENPSPWKGEGRGEGSETILAH